MGVSSDAACCQTTLDICFKRGPMLFVSLLQSISPGFVDTELLQHSSSLSPTIKPTIKVHLLQITKFV